VPYLLHGPGPLLYAVVPYTVGGGAAAWLFSTAVIAEEVFSRGNASDWEVVACVWGVCVALVVGATLHALRQTLEGEAFATPVLVGMAALFGTALVGWALGLARRHCWNCRRRRGLEEFLGNLDLDDLDDDLDDHLDDLLQW
jgi:hypothetical protein